MPEQGKCRKCGRDVLWMWSRLGITPTALDPAQVADGRYGVVDDRCFLLESGSVAAEFYDGPRYRYHLETCEKSP